MASPVYDCITRLLGTPRRRSALFGIALLFGALAGGTVTAQPLARVSPAVRLANSALAPIAGGESVLQSGGAASADLPADLGSGAEALAASIPGDENWQELFGVKQAATDGDIFAMVNNGTDIYVVGSFTSIGGVRANHVARWDGKTWNRLGDSLTNGVDANAYAIAVSSNGDTVYVGGEFSMAGGAPAARVARFVKSKEQWAALGAGLTGNAPVYVGAMSYDRGLLYVGGNFTTAGGQAASSVARWNVGGGNWSPLGSGTAEGVDGEIYSMAVGGNGIYVGGNFSRAGGASANNVAMWSTSGNSWNALGNGVRGYVNALTIWKDQITAGGDFDIDTLKSVGLGTWDGSSWAPLSALLGQPGMYSDAPAASHPGGVVRALAANGPVLYVGGAFRAVSPGSFTNAALAANFIVKWNGTALNTAFEPISSSTGNGTSGPVNTILFTGTNLYAGGAFRSAGGINASRIALYDGKKWQPLGEERYETQNIYAVLVNGNDIYIGRPENAYGQGSIAKWNGSGWTTLGLTAGSVYALAISGNELFVGGHFSSVEGMSAVNIARFNLTTKTWSAFGEGSGVGGGTYSSVQALAVNGDQLYIGGRYLIADTIAASDIVIYNRSSNSWQALGTGIEGTDFNIINAIALAPNGDVYVGGRFSRAGGVATNGIAKYSNGTWSALGSGLGGAVNAIALLGNTVYAGGDFTTAGGAPARRVASWDGTSWSDMGGGVSGGPLPIVFGLAANGNSVYVAGLFRLAGSDSVSRIVRWSTTSNSWQKLGSGVDNTVRAVAYSNGILHVVGEFMYAGGKTSPTYGQWSSAADGKIVRDPEEGRIALGQNYPNPFNPTTVIRFQLDQPGYTTLRVFDVSGNEVRRLVEGDLPAGEHEVIFDGTDLGSGMYFYQLKSGGLMQTKKLLLSK